MTFRIPIMGPYGGVTVPRPHCNVVYGIALLLRVINCVMFLLDNAGSQYWRSLRARGTGAEYAVRRYPFFTCIHLDSTVRFNFAPLWLQSIVISLPVCGLYVFWTAESTERISRSRDGLAFAGLM